MRWKAAKKLENGEQRTISTFLFWPRTIGDETRWLEFAKILQRYKIVYHKQYFLRRIYEGWEDVAWR